MKRMVYILATVVLSCGLLQAQVIVRNDFVFNRKARKLENRGITFITFNLSRHPNLNQLVHGRGGSTLVVDVQRLRHRAAPATYDELVEKIYMPPAASGPAAPAMPMRWLMPAPPEIKIPAAGFRYRNRVQTTPLKML